MDDGSCGDGLSPNDIRRFLSRIAAIAVSGAESEGGIDDAAAAVETITALEELKAAAAGAQAVLTTQVADTIRRGRRDAGRPAARWNTGIATQIGLARKDSPHRGTTHLGLARALTADMPHTLGQLRRGDLSEWRATILVRETACLTADDRRIVDERLCADPTVLTGKGDSTVAAMAARLAAELDAAAVARRKARGVQHRRVSVRPAPDFMGHLGALLPMDRAVCVWATLRRDADTLIATGDADGRTRDQVMADLLVERTIGLAHPLSPPVAVQVVISDQSLFGGSDIPAEVPGHGPIPAAAAREWIHDAVDSDTAVTLRKLYARPTDGQLTAVESVARCFPTGLARLIDLRDRTCRTPWCDAPIRHHDHITPHEDGGPTTADNGLGLCAACNLAKQGDGWATTRTDDTDGTGAHADVHTVEFRTPTGHTYRSRPPAQPLPMRHRKAG
ncbi:HNH endonuclease [Rhodococcoides corynebacterioides]|uniref:HNH endonuclease n=1 Tax=Rhodococcoides corynebacterioides TaxID=53972 RepID=UPI0027E1113F|nr:HNH endonuclease signature motif containing protein [Rhodococcus corynebacterioides]